MNTKRNIFLWALYDFANSIISIVFLLYFSQWVVIERGVKDIYFNLTFTVSALLLLLTVPVAGYLSGKYFRRITGLRCSTVVLFLAYSLCALSAVFEKEVYALIFFMFGLYMYLLTFTFYTPLLNDLSTETTRGKVSGIGVLSNYTGQFVALLFVLPFSKGMVSIFNSSPRAETLLPAVLLFIVLALPMLIWFKEPKQQKKSFKLKEEIQSLKTETKSLFMYPGILLFLLAYFLFNDAILTVSNNFSIFLEQVWNVSDSIKTLILLGILCTSALGGYVSGIISDKFGYKRTLIWIIVGWTILLPLIGLATNFTLFVFLTVLLGFWFGSNWAVSRSVMCYLAPKEGHNLAFAYFGLVERASSFVGPVVWGLVVSGFVSYGDIRYRYAILAVTVFIVLGFVALLKVRSDRKI